MAADVVEAIRQRSPVLVNLTTGTMGSKGAMGGGVCHCSACVHSSRAGELGPTGGPIACLEATQPYMAALNSGSLNYLR